MDAKTEKILSDSLRKYSYDGSKLENSSHTNLWSMIIDRGEKYCDMYDWIDDENERERKIDYIMNQEHEGFLNKYKGLDKEIYNLLQKQGLDSKVEFLLDDSKGFFSIEIEILTKLKESKTDRDEDIPFREIANLGSSNKEILNKLVKWVEKQYSVKVTKQQSVAWRLYVHFSLDNQNYELSVNPIGCLHIKRTDQSSKKEYVSYSGHFDGEFKDWKQFTTRIKSLMKECKLNGEELDDKLPF